MKASLMLATLAAVCACATPRPALAGDRAAQGPWQVELIGNYGQTLRTFEHGGRTWVLGAEQDRYRIRVTNRSARRVEAVVSVDGRDAIDGKPARMDKPGYIIAPWGTVTIDGFRLNMRDVATFRFASVPESYAAQTGSAREVGVIGVAVFQERYVAPPAPPPIRRQPLPDDCCDESSAEAPARGAEGKSRSSADGAGRAGPGPSAPRSEAGERDDRRSRDSDRPGLGTAFGERRSSPVVQVDFVRSRAWRPDGMLALRYNDRSGLIAMGIEVDPPRRHHWRDDPRYREQWRRETARPFADAPRSFAAPPPGWDD